MTNHTTTDSRSQRWEMIVDECAARLESVQHGMSESDWTTLGTVAWSEPPTGLGEPPEHIRERLQRLLDMSHTLQRRIATEMHAVKEELSQGPQVRKANRAYLRAGGAAVDPPPVA